MYKILFMRWMAFILLMFSTQAVAQCKTYIIGVRHDTLNCTDNNNNKQGKWVMSQPAKYGNPGYSEEGVFVDNKKEGVWRMYSAQGDVLAIENYRWGQKNGLCDYYTLNGIEHEESWKATNPDNPYDTIQVPDLHDENKIYLKVVKIEASTSEHGTWTFYDTQTGLITKTKTYILGQEVDPVTGKPIGMVKNGTAYASNGKVPVQLQRRDSTTAAHKPPPEVKAWEKKHTGKKSFQVRDGATGN